MVHKPVPVAAGASKEAPHGEESTCVDAHARIEATSGEDKIMKIVTSMSRLGLVLLVLTSAAAASAEGDSYWAVAMKDEELVDELGYKHRRSSAYGAAWNFASLEEAEQAALEACGKQDADPHGGCYISLTGKDSCFVVANLIFHNAYVGTYTGFADWGPFPSRTVAEAETDAIRSVVYRDSYGTFETANIETIECAGVQ